MFDSAPWCLPAVRVILCHILTALTLAFVSANADLAPEAAKQINDLQLFSCAVYLQLSEYQKRLLNTFKFAILVFKVVTLSVGEFFPTFWRITVPSKHWVLLTQWHSITPHHTWTLGKRTTRTSNTVLCSICFPNFAGKQTWHCYVHIGVFLLNKVWLTPSNLVLIFYMQRSTQLHNSQF